MNEKKQLFNTDIRFCVQPYQRVTCTLFRSSFPPPPPPPLPIFFSSTPSSLPPFFYLYFICVFIHLFVCLFAHFVRCFRSFFLSSFICFFIYLSIYHIYLFICFFHLFILHCIPDRCRHWRLYRFSYQRDGSWLTEPTALTSKLISLCRILRLDWTICLSASEKGGTSEFHVLTGNGMEGAQLGAVVLIKNDRNPNTSLQDLLPVFCAGIQEAVALGNYRS